MRNKKAIIYTVVFLILLSIVFTKWPMLQKPSEQEKLTAGLKLGQLAELPMNATDVKVESKGNLFSKTVYISFKASKEDIESFINSSSSLNKMQPAIRDYTNKGSSVYFTFSDGTVSWFNVKTKKARFYEIPQDKNANYGTVIVDDSTNTVYIRTSHS